MAAVGNVWKGRSTSTQPYINEIVETASFSPLHKDTGME